MSLTYLGSYDLRDQFKVPSSNTPYAPDSTYVCPTKDKVLKFAKWFYRKQKMRGLIWATDYDCDNWARRFCVEAQESHYRSQKKLAADEYKAEAIAVGEFHYKQDDGQYHAIVCAFCTRSTGTEVVFIEPQTGEEVCLSYVEQQSRFFVRF